MSQLAVLAAFLITVIKRKKKKLPEEANERREDFLWGQFERTQWVLAEKHGRSMVLAAMVCAKVCYISEHQEAKRNQALCRALLEPLTPTSQYLF